MQKGDVLAHGRIICLAGYSDILSTFADQLSPLLIQPVIGADVFGIFVITARPSDIAFCILVIVVCEGLSFGTFKSVFFNFQNHISVYFFAGLAKVFVLQDTINLELLAEGGFGDRVVIFVVFFAEAGIFADDDFFTSVYVLHYADDIDPFLIPASIVARINTLQGFLFQFSMPPFPAYAFILLTTVYHKQD